MSAIFSADMPIEAVRDSKNQPNRPELCCSGFQSMIFKPEATLRSLVSQLIAAFSHQEGRTFSGVVLVEFPRPGAWTLGRVGGPKELLAVRIKSTAAPPLATLLERAGGKPAADASLVTG